MTAPGNDALLITLLAGFTACVGYAAGRLHQWYRTGLDRDEAYRDGYDTATRSVFSLAARLIGPRRAARGTAAVTPPPVPMPSSPSRSAPVSMPSSLSRSASVSSVVVPSPPGSMPSSPSRSASVPSVADAAFPGLQPGGSALAGPVSAGADRVVPASRRPPVVPPSASTSDEVVGGRHYVPDELVQAPTYRLAPDRVARAKVRGAVPPDAEAQDPPPHPPSVPRPRSS